MVGSVQDAVPMRTVPPLLSSSGFAATSVEPSKVCAAASGPGSWTVSVMRAGYPGWLPGVVTMPRRAAATMRAWTTRCAPSIFISR